MWEKQDWYDTPLAYDIIYDADTLKEAAFLEAVWERHGMRRRRPRVLEAACGSGRVMAELRRRGWAVDGFDINERMLQHARERLAGQEGGTRGRLWRAELASFEPPRGRRYGIAHCLVSTFKYLLTEEAARQALRRLEAALEPGGLLVLGLHLTDYERTGCEHERWVEERDGVRVVCNTRTWPADRRTRLERVRTRLRVSRGGEERALETVWLFRTYNARQLQGLLRAALPEMRLAGCYDFRYDISQPRKLDDHQVDVVVVLKKNAGAKAGEW